MATVSDLIRRTLRLIQVLADGEDPSTTEESDALDTLNDMLASWMEDNIRIDPGTLELTDTFPIDLADAKAVRFNFAVDLAPEYGVPLDPAIIARARHLYNTMQAKYNNIPDASFDSALYQQNNYGWDINNS